MLDVRLPLSERFIANTHRVLELLYRYDVRATFFVLGKAAELAPQLVRDIHYAGHEVQSHGYGHELVHTLTASAFRDDLRRAKDLLEDIIGAPITAYRAPAFSISRRNAAALDVLVETGHTVDSSIFPLRLRRYGVSGSPRGPYRLRAPNGGELLEFPVASLQWLGRRWPAGGGGYFRLLPSRVIEHAVQQLNTAGDPAVIYTHPYEFNPDELRSMGRAVPLWRRLNQGLGRRGFAVKIERLLQRFRFAPLRTLGASSGAWPAFSLQRERGRLVGGFAVTRPGDWQAFLL